MDGLLPHVSNYYFRVMQGQYYVPVFFNIRGSGDKNYHRTPVVTQMRQYRMDVLIVKAVWLQS